MNIREELYRKMENEYDSFIENLKQLSTEQIIDSSYERVVKEEIVLMFYPEYEKYDINYIKILNKSKRPLEELYQGWMEFDGGIDGPLEHSIYSTMETLKRELNEKNISMER